MEKMNELAYRAERYLTTKSESQPEQINVSCKTILAIAEAFRELEQPAEAAEAKLAELEKQQLIIPEGLNRYTAELVLDFAKAIAEKLHQSELKYGWSDGWKESDWQDKCLADFHHHISKGDPRDVAAYCAFMWHHEWPTRAALAVHRVPEGCKLVPVEPTKQMLEASYREASVYSPTAYRAMLAAAPTPPE